jgi:hypothetical protein
MKRRGMTTFTAKWGGRCGLCDDRYEPGEECAYWDDEVCHADCALEELES